MITYKGKEYQTREITICPHDMAMTVTVAKEELYLAMKPRLLTSEQKETCIDEGIIYYCNEEEWAMSDCEMAKFLEGL